MPLFPALPTDLNGVPISSGYVPNDQFRALQMSQRTKVDTLGFEYAPIVMESVNQEYVRSGLLYVATTGELATATNPNLVMGASLFNAALSGKTVLVLSAKLSQSAAQNSNQLNLTTVNPSLATTLSATCMLAGGGIGATASVTCPAAGATASVATPGTVLDWQMTGGASTIEFIPPGFGYLLPNGSAYGLAVYTVIASAGGLYAVTFKWVEY